MALARVRFRAWKRIQVWVFATAWDPEVFPEKWNPFPGFPAPVGYRFPDIGGDSVWVFATAWDPEFFPKKWNPFPGFPAPVLCPGSRRGRGVFRNGRSTQVGSKAYRDPESFLNNGNPLPRFPAPVGCGWIPGSRELPEGFRVTRWR
jgi:hypothetical protein